MTLRDTLVRIGFLMAASGGMLAVWALIAGVHHEPELPEEPDDDEDGEDGYEGAPDAAEGGSDPGDQRGP